MDLSRRGSVSGDMDERNQIEPKTARLINGLLNSLGMLMEDASSLALLRDSCGGSVAQRLRMLEDAITKMGSICAAAKALLNG